MEQVAAAVNSRDAAALKAMFSPVALEQATEIDERLDYFLSFFPNGGLTWKRETANSSGHNYYGKKTELVMASYTVSADGNDYWLFFADFTVNEVENPDNVGLYALGVTPWTEDRLSGPAEPFRHWTGSFTIDESDDDGYPGVYFPPDNIELSIQKLNQIVDELNTEDSDGLRLRFSVYAQLEHREIDDQIEELFALFPDRDVVWEELAAVPVVRENADNGEKQSLLLSTHRVSSGGADYRLFFAYFTESSVIPDNLGLYAIGVAPWTESGDSAAEQALSAWAETFDVDASVPPGVFISK